MNPHEVGSAHLFTPCATKRTPEILLSTSSRQRSGLCWCSLRHHNFTTPCSLATSHKFWLNAPEIPTNQSISDVKPLSGSLTRCQKYTGESSDKLHLFNRVGGALLSSISTLKIMIGHLGHHGIFTNMQFWPSLKSPVLKAFNQTWMIWYCMLLGPIRERGALLSLSLSGHL